MHNVGFGVRISVAHRSGVSAISFKVVVDSACLER